VRETQTGHPNDVGHQALAEVVLSLLPSIAVPSATVATAVESGDEEP
jgi:hypothetical protein